MKSAPAIHWRYATLGPSTPDLVNDEAQLSLAEQAELATWRTSERRAQWLLARRLARELVCTAHPSLATDAAASAMRVEVLSRADGRGTRPVVFVDGQRLPASLSVAHADCAVLVALSAEPDVSLGVDLVRPISLGDAFLSTWFSVEERALAGSDPHEVCRLWAVKEALFKAINGGESFMPRRLDVRRDAAGQYRAAYHGQCLADRAEIRVWQCEEHLAALVAVRTAAGPAGSIELSPGNVELSLQLEVQT